MNKYLDVVYSEKLRPYTKYPEKLASYLFQEFNMKPGQNFLEPGCGRGEMLKCFEALGLKVYGCDLSSESVELSKGVEIKVCDVEQVGLPYPDNTFDIIYSKSFLEHFYYPERYIKEAYRVLRPGGMMLNLVPDWEANYQKYYDDYTHRTPFTNISLRDIQLIHGFDLVKVIKFRQLPITWKYPFLNFVFMLIAPFVPLRTKSKFRWVREIMLIGMGIKPLSARAQK